MNRLITYLDRLTQPLEKLHWLLPTLARLVFATSLAGYFWASAKTKLGDGILGIFQPSLGAYVQIFPQQMEAVTYDVSQLTFGHWIVVMAGTWAEFLLPALIIAGFLTRLSALGMIGFVIVQTLTDLFGHKVIEHPETIGAWFDRFPDGVILDQRAFWMLLLATLVIKGAGPLSVDRMLKSAP